jgi:hypothetical protein
MKRFISIALVLFSSAAMAHTEVILNSGVVQSVNAKAFTVESSHKLISVNKVDVLKLFNFKTGSKVFIVKYIKTSGINQQPFYAKTKVVKYSLLPVQKINTDLALMK